MPLCYAMQCCALQRAVPEPSFLAKPHQPNVYDNQMVPVDTLEGYKLDTPTTHGYLRHGLDHWPAHNHDCNHNHGLDSHGLSNHDPDLWPQHFMRVGCSSIS